MFCLQGARVYPRQGMNGWCWVAKKTKTFQISQSNISLTLHIWVVLCFVCVRKKRYILVVIMFVLFPQVTTKTETQRSCSRNGHNIVGLRDDLHVTTKKKSQPCERLRLPHGKLLRGDQPTAGQNIVVVFLVDCIRVINACFHCCSCSSCFLSKYIFGTQHYMRE